MADAFFLRTAIVGCSTVRHEDGLALSSRNTRLATPDRARAPLLYRAISTAPSAADALSRLEAEGFAVDYVVDAMGRRLAAARLNGVRLIDNVALETAK
jgi:pantoate--beta-alanine ligase